VRASNLTAMRFRSPMDVGDGLPPGVSGR